MRNNHDLKKRYPSDEKIRRDVLKDFPEEIENELHQKKADLNKRLKEVSNA